MKDELKPKLLVDTMPKPALEFNFELNRFLNKLKKKVDKSKIKEIEQQKKKWQGANSFYNRKVREFQKKGMSELEAKKTAKEFGFIKRDISQLNNQLKMVKGEDFEFTINDTFGAAYKIKASELANKKNPTEYIFKKYIQRVNQAIKKPSYRFSKKDIELMSAMTKKAAKEYGKDKLNKKVEGLRKLKEKVNENLKRFRHSKTQKGAESMVEELVEIGEGEGVGEYLVMDIEISNEVISIM